jgi:hypothetical protein
MKPATIIGAILIVIGIIGFAVGGFSFTHEHQDAKIGPSTSSTSRPAPSHPAHPQRHRPRRRHRARGRRSPQPLAPGRPYFIYARTRSINSSPSSGVSAFAFGPTRCSRMWSSNTSAISHRSRRAPPPAASAHSRTRLLDQLRSTAPSAHESASHDSPASPAPGPTPCFPPIPYWGILCPQQSRASHTPSLPLAATPSRAQQDAAATAPSQLRAGAQRRSSPSFRTLTPRATCSPGRPTSSSRRTPASTRRTPAPTPALPRRVQDLAGGHPLRGL